MSYRNTDWLGIQPNIVNRCVRQTGILLHKILAENNRSNIPHVLEESQFAVFNLWEKARTILR